MILIPIQSAQFRYEKLKTLPNPVRIIYIVRTLERIIIYLTKYIKYIDVIGYTLKTFEFIINNNNNNPENWLFINSTKKEKEMKKRSYIKHVHVNKYCARDKTTFLRLQWIEKRFQNNFIHIIRIVVLFWFHTGYGAHISASGVYMPTITRNIKKYSKSSTQNREGGGIFFCFRRRNLVKTRVFINLY